MSAHDPYGERMHDHHLTIRAWCLALRDLCASGAESVTAVLPGGIVLDYTPESGASLITGGGTTVLDEAWIDDHGMVVA